MNFSCILTSTVFKLILGLMQLDLQDFAAYTGVIFATKLSTPVSVYLDHRKPTVCYGVFLKKKKKNHNTD